ncbi:MAG TPA: bifunctional phosphoribosylaminoimidazolecarboxamide formyltransferase/IMP cyclohydrolase [Vicinamibacteria bacterium]|nr:bifunctional phosphoribosylaminoimidazolecarboxamide formyltransferase/IMP cyclohydrolase [Vicinamibacteria bacterium]
MTSTKSALLSVANKDGLPEFARGLAERGYRIVSSGGTARALEGVGIDVVRVSEVTGFPEILDGRVKTLDPRIHGGILARRDLDTHMAELNRHGIGLVDIVTVNFYPFDEKVVEGCGIDEVIENIDVGGPSMLRAAAKNFRYVLAVTDPKDYPTVLEQIDEGVDMATRVYLAVKAFRSSARYEAAIASYVERLRVEGDSVALDAHEDASFPSRLTLTFERVQHLRYGENPHQAAAFYRDAPIGMGGAQQLHGKELSYNNILDLDAAFRLVRELPRERAAACVIKHTNPCGAAVADTLAVAYVRAREVDPISAFGGIVGLNRRVDGATADELSATFLEAVIAPGFDRDALEALKGRKNLRLLQVEDGASAWAGSNLFRVVGGLLVQDWDREEEEIALEVVSQREPTETERRALEFAWIVAKHVKSNAIVLAGEDVVLGVGAGQMSRVDSCRLAVSKARSSLEGAVAASDAFFPFPDGVEVLADAGVKAVIQPGGSVRDEDVIRVANERGLAMVFTGRRHFRH